MGKLKNPFAKKMLTDELIHIDEYIQMINENAELKIVCPNCKIELKPRALNSTKITKHFYHVTDCNCNGLESALHKYSKELFNKLIGNSIKLPSQKYIASMEFSRIGSQINHDFEKLFKPMLIEEIRKIEHKHKCHYGYYDFIGRFDKEIYACQKEAWFDINCAIDNDSELFSDKQYNVVIDSCVNERKLCDEVISDAFINDKLNIEIFVTHKIDEHKSKALKQNNIPTIEIDMSRFSTSKDLFCKDSIIEFLLENVESKKFYNFTKYDEAINNVEKLIRKAFNDNYKSILEKFEQLITVKKINDGKYPEKVRFNKKTYIKYSDEYGNWGHMFFYDVTLKNGEKHQCKITQSDIFRYYVQENPQLGYGKIKLKYEKMVPAGVNKHSGLFLGDHHVFNVYANDEHERDFWLTNKRVIEIISYDLKNYIK